MSSTLSAKTFISYAREDAEFALKLAEDLRAAGAAIWIDQLDIAGGARWDDAVQEALNACPRMVVILSPASVSSDNVMDEVSYALRRGNAVVPVLYRECEIPFRLDRLQRVDVRGAGVTELVRVLAVGAELTKSRPSRPWWQRWLQRPTRTTAIALVPIVAVTAVGWWIVSFNMKLVQKPTPTRPEPTITNATTTTKTLSAAVPTDAVTNRLKDAKGQLEQLTHLEAEAFLQTNRGNIERCLSRLSKHYYIVDFVFTPSGDDRAINMDIIPGEEESPDSGYLHPGERIESLYGDDVLRMRSTPEKLSVTAPDVNGCLVGALKNELRRYSLKGEKSGFIHRYITDRGRLF